MMHETDLLLEHAQERERGSKIVLGTKLEEESVAISKFAVF